MRLMTWVVDKLLPITDSQCMGGVEGGRRNPIGSGLAVDFIGMYGKYIYILDRFYFDGRMLPEHTNTWEREGNGDELALERLISA